MVVSGGGDGGWGRRPWGPGQRRFITLAFSLRQNPLPFSGVALCQGETAVADVDFLSPLSTMATETANYCALISVSQPQH